MKVLLSGAGGDDLFTGYRRHHALLLEKPWRVVRLLLQHMVVDIYEEIQDGSVIIVNNSPDELAAAIELALTKHGLSKLGNKARDWVFKELNTEKVSSQYISTSTLDLIMPLHC